MSNRQLHIITKEEDSPSVMQNSNQPQEPQRQKKKYSVISQEIREKFIKRVISREVTIKEAAKEFGIKFSTSKAILQTYKREGRTGKKKTRQRKPRMVKKISMSNNNNLQDQHAHSSDQSLPIQKPNIIYKTNNSITKIKDHALHEKNNSQQRMMQQSQHQQYMQMHQQQQQQNFMQSGANDDIDYGISDPELKNTLSELQTVIHKNVSPPGQQNKNSHSNIMMDKYRNLPPLNQIQKQLINNNNQNNLNQFSINGNNYSNNKNMNTEFYTNNAVFPTNYQQKVCKNVIFPNPFSVANNNNFNGQISQIQLFQSSNKEESIDMIQLKISLKNIDVEKLKNAAIRNMSKQQEYRKMGEFNYTSYFST